MPHGLEGWGYVDDVSVVVGIDYKVFGFYVLNAENLSSFDEGLNEWKKGIPEEEEGGEGGEGGKGGERGAEREGVGKGEDIRIYNEGEIVIYNSNNII